MVDRSKALTWTEVRVGLVVLLSLAVLAVTILYIGSGAGSPFAKKYTLRALMRDVNGLKEGAPVRVGGVEVGTVTKVDFAKDAGGMVEVEMRVDRRMQERVTSQSRASLGTLGLLGEKAVDITAAPGGVPIPDDQYVPPGSEDAIKGLLADASESTAHLKKILARMDAGEGLIGKALRDEELYDRMLDVSVRMQKVMDKLESERGPLGMLVNDEEVSKSLKRSAQGLDSIVARIEQGKGPLGALSKDEMMVADLKGITTSVNEVAGRIHRGEGSLGKLMTDERFYEQLTAVSSRLDALVGRVEKGEGSLGRLMQDNTFYDNLDGAAVEMRRLLEDVRKDPAKYLRVKLSVF